MLALTILAAVLFNVTSGFHDAAEICAPGVVTGAIRPAGALILFAVMVFIGPFLAGTAVADTIGGFVHLSGEDPITALGIVAAGIAGAAVWNIVTWRFAIPSSLTHALVGGLVGVTMVVAGPGDVSWGLSALADGQLEGVTKIVVALVLSPIVGVVAGFLVFRIGRLTLRRATRRANRPLRRMLVGGTGLLAFAHGGNEAQKSMGVIALALVLAGRQSSFTIPLWVVVVSAATLALGGVTGGWGIAPPSATASIASSPCTPLAPRSVAQGSSTGPPCWAVRSPLPRSWPPRSPAPAPPIGHARCAGTRVRP